MRRVVITGMGIYSCIGKNLDEVTQSLYEGKSGIGIEEARTEYGYRSPLTGIVERPNLKPLLDRRLRTGLAEEGEYAYMATREALENAGIDMPIPRRKRGRNFLWQRFLGKSGDRFAQQHSCNQKGYNADGFRCHFPVDELNGNHEPFGYF